jgi:hypothetical protein
MDSRRRMTGRLLTAREVADRYAVTAETVLRWTRRRELIAIRLPGTVRGRLRYREEDLAAFEHRQTTAGGATEEVSPAPNAATRRLEVSSEASPAPPVNPATTEEDS